MLSRLSERAKLAKGSERGKISLRENGDFLSYLQ